MQSNVPNLSEQFEFFFLNIIYFRESQQGGAEAEGEGTSSRLGAVQGA